MFLKALAGIGKYLLIVIGSIISVIFFGGAIAMARFENQVVSLYKSYVNDGTGTTPIIKLIKDNIDKIDPEKISNENSYLYPIYRYNEQFENVLKGLEELKGKKGDIPENILKEIEEYEGIVRKIKNQVINKVTKPGGEVYEQLKAFVNQGNAILNNLEPLLAKTKNPEDFQKIYRIVWISTIVVISSIWLLTLIFSITHLGVYTKRDGIELKRSNYELNLGNYIIKLLNENPDIKKYVYAKIESNTTSVK
ncbi:Uncharacterised protein [Metamycoplasma arthritidis]|uniref:Hypothetical membrane protein n=1 Tax=Metamycoplasma arthritidis (strain 158L3-1) TaxID=243272 RepID=B3PMH8_META1|nr:MG_279/MG_280 family protein [Metamycoplasma arthritidis]ACF07230.1 hypothetical membrane protein [Metamycoplasma arthritidis 158L3-1]VEU78754.1 Uncharacterised protein [Metamycoplasma arthritidis]